MNKQRMIRMLQNAKEAVDAAELNPTLLDGAAPITEGTQNLIGQLILASAIEESGSSISLSLDKLDGLALEISSVATMLRHK